MRALDSNNELWAWPRLQTNTSAIAAENASRSRYKTSVHEESSIKLTKNASIRPVLRKIECLAAWLSHVHKPGNHVTLRTHITWIIYSVRYSLPLLYTLLLLVVYMHNSDSYFNSEWYFKLRCLFHL